ncbi:histidinol-phosphate transaminase [Cryptotrichosporon argae]
MPILGVRTPGPAAPAHFSLERIVRPNILSLVPYRAARDDYSAGVLLDANENALGPSLPAPDADADATADASMLSPDELAALHRYPSPTHDDVKRLIADFRGLPGPDWVFLGVGSDEVIDMLFRCLCVPAKDRVVVTPPTYGMYSVTAHVNDVGVVKVPLIVEDGRFEVDEEKLNSAFLAHPDLKLLFLCSPGNPTGTLIPVPLIRRIAENPSFTGVVVVDEAYVDFSPPGASAAALVRELANVCVTQTLSKSFGLAAIRLGYLLASPELVQVLTNAKAPYNVSVPTASLARRALGPAGRAVMHAHVDTLNANRTALVEALAQVDGVGKVLGGNDANFVLVQILKDGKPSNDTAQRVYKTMAETKGVVVRFRGNELGCEGCLRITVGTEDECRTAVEKIAELLSE